MTDTHVVKIKTVPCIRCGGKSRITPSPRGTVEYWKCDDCDFVRLNRNAKPLGVVAKNKCNDCPAGKVCSRRVSGRICDENVLRYLKTGEVFSVTKQASSALKYSMEIE